MKHSLLLFLTLSALPFSAHADQRDKVIKSAPITVSDCATGAVTRQGNAVLFQPAFGESGYFGLTTLSSVMEGTDVRKCVTAENEAHEKVSGKVIRWDYTMGLAIVKFDRSIWTSDQEEIATLLLWSHPEYLHGRSLQIRSTFASTQFISAMQVTERHTFFDPKRGYNMFAEVIASAPLKASARGGLLQTPDSNAKSDGFFGMVTDNYIRLIPGQMSQVHLWKDESEAQNHLVILRLDEIVDFLTRTLGNPQEDFQFFPSQKDPESLGVESNGLIFEPDCPKENERFQPSGNYPIGGNNGHGIGGEDLTGPLCKILIRRSKNPKFQENGILSQYASPRVSDWLKKTRLALETGGQLEAWYFIDIRERKDLEMSAKYLGQKKNIPLKKEGFSHLGGFFRILSDDSQLPVFRTAEGTARGPEYLGNARMLKLIKAIEARLLTPVRIESAPLVEFRRSAFAILAILQSNAWKMILAEDLMNLSNFKPETSQFTEAWDVMPFAIGKEETELLMIDLLRLTEMMMKPSAGGRQ
ncbi:MAG: hypothetical protein H7333_01910 [Bdellovibrionales bacterium]|nr:hypothetical protein [Oligoflexia bacterium]